MSDNTGIGDRMKKYYEDVTRNRLVRRMPVIIRLDGRAFHTLTSKCDKPFDPKFMYVMWETAAKLFKEVQGCQLAYVQSDEISLLLTDYQTLDTQAWFDYNIQKLVSISASIATQMFNSYVNNIKHSLPGYFDARVFNIPREEVVNYFIWRQQDCTRNSIQSVGQANFSQKQLHGLSCNQIQEKLLTEKNINWNKYGTPEKRGTCITWKEKFTDLNVDIPIFTQDRNYIQKYVDCDKVIEILPDIMPDIKSTFQKEE